MRKIIQPKEKKQKIMQLLQSCIGPSIRISQESWCLPYAGFLVLVHHETLVRYLKDPPNLNGLGNRQKKSSKTSFRRDIIGQSSVLPQFCPRPGKIQAGPGAGELGSRRSWGSRGSRRRKKNNIPESRDVNI